jgi:hypothetical protein
VGEEIRMVGRTSGVVKGKVIGVNVTAAIGLPEPPGFVTFNGLVACAGENGKALSQPGDSGAPVVNTHNQLVGMLYAGSDDRSLFIPIRPILEALEVELEQ